MQRPHPSPTNTAEPDSPPAHRLLAWTPLDVSPQSLRSLEYREWFAVVSGFALTEPGRAIVRQLVPIAEQAEIERRLILTAEIAFFIEETRDFPLGGMEDIRPLLQKSAMDGYVLDPEGLLDIMLVIAAAGSLKRRIEQTKFPLPRLRELFDPVVLQVYLEELFHKTFDERGQIRDSASRELAKIREEIRRLKDKINRTLHRLLEDPKLVGVFQDRYVTERNGRFVLPVNNDQKWKIKGVVHYTSASGATVFLEPLEILEDNNRLIRQIEEEERKIRRILRFLTQSIGAHRDEIELSYAVLIECDVLRAFAMCASHYSLVRPEFTASRELMLLEARHPLLLTAKSREQVVPIDLNLGNRYDMLVITGPNTGGKTVALKTVGLCQLLAQTGCPIPAQEGTRLPLLRKVFADIGDDQDVMGSLSTFSSHIVKIRHLLEKADDSTLVLLDELGTGTDPAEGSALGIAILRYLHRRRSMVMASTHHEPLKAFAYAEPYAENGSVEFDTLTLRPTYRLITGIPGESNAFQIAANLHLPEEVLAEARRFKDEGFGRTSDLLGRLERDTRELRTARSEAEEKARQATEYIERAESKFRLAQTNADLILQQAHRQAESLLQDATGKAQRLLEHTRRKVEALRQEVEETANAEKLARAAAELAAEESALERYRREEAEHQTRANELKERTKGKLKPAKAPTRKLLTLEDIELGRKYLVKTLNKEGIAASIDTKRSQITMQVKGMLVKVMPDQLGIPDGTQLLEEHRRERLAVFEDASGATPVPGVASKETQDWLNVRGKRVEEALDLVEPFLDQALLARLPKVSIIHGIGSGALKSAIRALLDDHRGVAGYRDGEQWEGGQGVTQVVLDVR